MIARIGSRETSTPISSDGSIHTASVLSSGQATAKWCAREAAHSSVSACLRLSPGSASTAAAIFFVCASLAAATGTEPLTVDFKEKATPRLAECVASMANAHRGLILVGITDTDRKVIGVKTETLAHVADMLATRLDPADWLPEMFEVSLGDDQPGKHVLVIRIRRDLSPRPVLVQRTIGSGDDKASIFWIPVRIPGGTRQAARGRKWRRCSPSSRLQRWSRRVTGSSRPCKSRAARTARPIPWSTWCSRQACAFRPGRPVRAAAVRARDQRAGHGTGQVTARRNPVHADRTDERRALQLPPPGAAEHLRHGDAGLADRQRRDPATPDDRHGRGTRPVRPLQCSDAQHQCRDRQQAQLLAAFAELAATAPAWNAQAPGAGRMGGLARRNDGYPH